MASVREELVEMLEKDFDCSHNEAVSAVEKAIGEGRREMEGDIETVAEHIYSTQYYWE